MTQEELQSGRDDMLIDGREPLVPEKKQGGAVPNEFDANYLQVYYGIFHFLFDCSSQFAFLV